MKEYWVNVYERFDPSTGKNVQFVGRGFTQRFRTREEATIYSSSNGLRKVYCIRVKMDDGYNKYREQYAKMVKDLKNRRVVSSIDWMGY